MNFEKKTVDLKARQWGEKVIVLAELRNAFNVYLIKLWNADKKLEVLNPVQRLPKHGTSQNIAIFDFENCIYCLMASTYGSENRYIYLMFVGSFKMISLIIRNFLYPGRKF